MKKILLACAAGMSTSIITAKMKKYAESIGEDTEIQAFPAQTGVEIVSQGWDIVLLGPQVRFLEQNFKDAISKAGLNVPVVVIPFQDYGMANGEAIYKLAVKTLETNK